MDGSVTVAYVRILTLSLFPSKLSLLHLYLNQKMMLKTNKQTNKNLSLKVGGLTFNGETYAWNKRRDPQNLVSNTENPNENAVLHLTFPFFRYCATQGC